MLGSGHAAATRVDTGKVQAPPAKHKPIVAAVYRNALRLPRACACDAEAFTERAPRDGVHDDDDVVRCFIEVTFKHSKAPGAVRASKKRYPFLRPVISRGCRG